MAETVAELRALSDDEIMRLHDAKATSTAVGTQHYLAELARRDAARQGDRIEALTQTMARLTWIIAILTGVNLLAALATVVIPLVTKQ